MSSPISRLPAVARSASSASLATFSSLPAAFAEQLAALYGLAERSQHVFGSPLGPFYAQGRHYHLPRFVYFGPHTSDAGVRLAFFSGLDHRDLRGTLALLHLVEGLALKPDIGQGLHLSFFPLVDVLGLARVAPERQLSAETWISSSTPELQVLEKDIRRQGYHGFVRLESAPGEDVITVRLRAPENPAYPTPAVDFVNSSDFAPFEVRWERETNDSQRMGPLALADDLPLTPFELTVRVPSAWAPDLYRTAAASILKRFVLRYRGFIAYGQHL